MVLLVLHKIGVIIHEMHQQLSGETRQFSSKGIEGVVVVRTIHEVDGLFQTETLGRDLVLQTFL